MNIKYIKTFTAYFLALGTFVTPLLANPKIEQAILKEISQNIKITSREIKDANVAKCFSGPIYTAEVDLTIGDVTSTSISSYIMKDDGVIEFTQPITDQEMPELHSIVNPEFRLKTKEDGEHLIKAMKVILGSAFDEDKVEPHFVQNGSTWSMIIDTFFKDFSGFIFETNVDGKITKISRSLHIKK
jgi:hypothetical protein